MSALRFDPLASIQWTSRHWFVQGDSLNKTTPAPLTGSLHHCSKALVLKSLRILFESIKLKSSTLWASNPIFSKHWTTSSLRFLVMSTCGILALSNSLHELIC
ncbi:hypothetical protein DERP_010214 [Dermatophagoides pteronyssinus]|uniref:Uncharacterized protein n=1 Tax=Dermatophagoides pteronyssinus TaxID=6956 RepID=A0ABQ8J7L1_DERPT|nr:hypothetical protein DERP_010214 [Dermatophagoides pteronyssinus]